MVPVTDVSYSMHTRKLELMFKPALLLKKKERRNKILSQGIISRIVEKFTKRKKCISLFGISYLFYTIPHSNKAFQYLI